MFEENTVLEVCGFFGKSFGDSGSANVLATRQILRVLPIDPFVNRFDSTFKLLCIPGK